MSGRLAYTLAVIIMICPFVILPSLYIYNLHRAHELRAQLEAQMEKNRAEIEERMEAERLARQNH
jgi:hypothetical protein